MKQNKVGLNISTLNEHHKKLNKLLEKNNYQDVD